MNDIDFTFPKFQEICTNFIKPFERDRPKWFKDMYFLLIKNAITYLKHYTENLEKTSTTIESPFIELQYHFVLDWDIVQPVISSINENDNQANAASQLSNYITPSRDMYIIKTITKGIVLIKDKDREACMFPKETIEVLDKLPKHKKQDAKNEFCEFIKNPDITFPISGIKKYNNTVTKNIEGALIFNFKPFTIDVETKAGYYVLIVGYDFFGEYPPTTWIKKDKRTFWKLLEEKLEVLIPSEKVYEIGTITPPLIKGISIENALVRASLHTELQKFGRKPLNEQPKLFDILDDKTRNDIKEYNIDIIGIENTQAQNQAIFAIQKILDSTNYKGNLKGYNLDGENAFNFRGYLPALKLKISDYLHAYGVRRRQTKRGKYEFNANERAEALMALKNLHDKRYLFYYERKYWERNKKGEYEELYDLIRTVKPLINITEGYKALTKLELDTIKIKGDIIHEKLNTLSIEICPILVDQIDTYFVLKPANCYHEIKILYPNTSKFVYLFIDFLFAEVAKREIASKGKGNTNWSLELNYRTMAEKLRMNSYLKSRNWKAIKKSLSNCYRIAKELGYLTEYETIQGVTKEKDVLIINPEKFKRMKEIELLYN